MLSSFWTALQFYTRLPVPSSYRYRPELLERASRFLPAVGWIVSLLSGIAGGAACMAVIALSWVSGLEAGARAAMGADRMPGLLAALRDAGVPLDSHSADFWTLPVMDPGIALLSALAGGIVWLGASLLVTGAFHEDGFADVWDGFGGGMGDRSRTLEIMKDSRLGTFGGAALVLLLVSRTALAVFLLENLMVWAGIVPGILAWIATLGVVAGMGRTVPLLVMSGSRYAREDASSKVKPLAKSLSRADLATGMLTGILPLAAWCLVLPGTLVAGALMVLLLPLAGMAARRIFESVLGGYTGDCLGASEQGAEVLFLVLASASLAGMMGQSPAFP